MNLKSHPAIGSAAAVKVRFLAGFTLGLAFCTGGCDGCAGDTTTASSVIARCEDQEGDVRTHPPNALTSSPLPAGAELSAGDWIETPAGAWARISLLSSARVEIESGSVLVLEEPGDGAVGAVTLRAGRMHGVIPAQVARREIVVKSAGGKSLKIARTGVEGPLDYQVRALDAGDLEVTLRSGHATVEAGGGVVALEPGRAQRIASGRLSGPPIVLPLAPEPISPAEGASFAELPSGPVELSWKPSAKAVRYRVEVASDRAFRHVVATASTAETRFEFHPARAGAYGWRVAAIDAGSNESESGSWARFTIEEPVPDALLYPPDEAVIAFSGAQPPITFSWRAIPEPAASYQVIVATGPDLSGPVVLDQRTEATLLKTRDLGQGEYAWGAYLVIGDRKTPLFPKPHRLILKRNDSGIQLPKKLKWE